MSNISKSELIAAVANKTGSSIKDTMASVEATLDFIETQLKKGNTVSLLGFATFEPVKKAARTARNPMTGASVSVAAKTVLKFKPGKAIKSW